MESRLPKPKTLVNKAASTLGLNSDKKNDQPTAGCSAVPPAPKCTTNGISIVNRANNENKPPPKPTLLNRAKTVSTITRRNAVSQRELLKRPALPTNTVDAKRPNLKTTKPISSTIGTKAVSKPSEMEKNINKPKPNKWDLKGRLAYATEELAELKQKYKDTSAEHTKLQETLKTIRDNQQDYKFKSEELEAKNEQMRKELELLTQQITELSMNKKKMEDDLKVQTEMYKEASMSLKVYKEKCGAQEMVLSEKDVIINDLEQKLHCQTKKCEEVNADNNKLLSMVHNMDRDRRVLHNTIQDLKGKIRVFCRVRPRTEKELGKKTCNMNFADECTIEIARADNTEVSCGKIRTTRQEFSFDKVFPPTASQEDVFEELALLVQSALEGYNVCVFAYGQTGSGKTYTMEGHRDPVTEGMIPRTVRHIFKEMKQFELLGWKYTIEASILEIYNEHIVDLLDSEQKTHEIRMADSKGSDLYVTNLRVEEIESPEKLHECLLIAQQNRAVAATMSNERSSRSHSVTRIRLIGKHATKDEVSIGNLNLVDLAGSERLKNEEASRTTETKSINKSLSNLGNVILALLKKQDHIPYRNSKLTHILMPSLGGNSKTLMLLNVSPLEECYNETLNSLRFASNVNNCRMGNAKRTKTVLQNSL